MECIPKIKYRTVLVFLVTALTVAMMCLCNRDTSLVSELGGSSESTSANITGTMYNSDGTRATDAIVRFVPTDYNGYYAKDTALVESTYTDENGVYAYKLTAGGFYNVSAEKNNASAFEDSIFVSTGNKTTVNDTLKATGSVSGVAHLDPGDDNRRIIILVLGTNIYTVPADTSGTFSLPALAEGDYILRILTTYPDYEYVDIPVSVLSEKNTTLSQVIQLKNSGVPKIGPVEIVYDTNMMYATLSWPPADTSRISGYYIYENPSFTETPLAILKSTDTMFRADAIHFGGFAYPVSYSVAAVGTDRRVGARSTTSEFLAATMLVPLDTIICEPMTDVYTFSVFILDGNPIVFMVGPGWIAKYDHNGTRIESYTNTDSYNPDITIWGGVEYSPVCYSYATSHVYALDVYGSGPDQFGMQQPDSVVLIKFTSDLVPVANVTARSFIDPYGRKNYPFKVTVDKNENIHLFYKLNDSTLTDKMIVVTYDTTFTETAIDTMPAGSSLPFVTNDTIYLAGFYNDIGRIASFDLEGNLVEEWSLETLGVGEFPPIENSRAGNVIRFASGGMLITSSDGMLLSDPDFNMVGRCSLKKNSCIIGSDADGRIFIEDVSMSATTNTSEANIIICKVRW